MIQLLQIYLLSNNPTLSVILPNGTVETKTVQSISGAVITVASAYSATPNVNTVWLIVRMILFNLKNLEW